MLNRIAKFFGTVKGFWLTMGLTLATCGLAVVITDVATFVLSVIAIVIPMFIMKLDHDKQKIADERDKAMHTKLDALIAAVPDADDHLQGIEPDNKDT